MQTTFTALELIKAHFLGVIFTYALVKILTWKHRTWEDSALRLSLSLAGWLGFLITLCLYSAEKIFANKMEKHNRFWWFM
jgi:hypothetical protein